MYEATTEPTDPDDPGPLVHLRDASTRIDELIHRLRLIKIGLGLVAVGQILTIIATLAD